MELFMSFRPYLNNFTSAPIVVVAKKVCFDDEHQGKMAFAMYSEDRLDAIALGWSILPLGRQTTTHWFSDELTEFVLNVEQEVVHVKRMSVIYRASSIG
jgi:hypothetical protein